MASTVENDMLGLTGFSTAKRGSVIKEFNPREPILHKPTRPVFSTLATMRRQTFRDKGLV